MDSCIVDQVSKSLFDQAEIQFHKWHFVLHVDDNGMAGEFPV